MYNTNTEDYTRRFLCALFLQSGSPNSLSRSLCLTLAVAIDSAANFCQALFGGEQGSTFLALSANAMPISQPGHFAWHFVAVNVPHRQTSISQTLVLLICAAWDEYHQ